MTNFNLVTELIIIEAFAQTYQLISSEKMLSDRFDKYVSPVIFNKYGKVIKQDMDNAFHAHADLLRISGELHDTQYKLYRYIGKYSGKE